MRSTPVERLHSSNNQSIQSVLKSLYVSQDFAEGVTLDCFYVALEYFKRVVQHLSQTHSYVLVNCKVILVGEFSVRSSQILIILFVSQTECLMTIESLLSGLYCFIKSTDKCSFHSPRYSFGVIIISVSDRRHSEVKIEI